MSRKLFLLFFAASVSVITACSSISGPARTDEEEPDSSELCEGVIAGTHTRCEDT